MYKDFLLTDENMIEINGSENCKLRSGLFADLKYTLKALLSMNFEHLTKHFFASFLYISVHFTDNRVTESLFLLILLPLKSCYITYKL